MAPMERNRKRGAVTDCPDSNLYRHCPKKYHLQMTLGSGENGNDNDGGSSAAVLFIRVMAAVQQCIFRRWRRPR